MTRPFNPASRQKTGDGRRSGSYPTDLEFTVLDKSPSVTVLLPSTVPLLLTVECII